MTESRMFTEGGKRVTTWNPVTGCKHGCVYCWARVLAEGRLRHLFRYQYGFLAHFNEEELRRKFKLGETVFVSSMGDLFGEWVPEEWIIQVLDRIRKFPDTTFLLLTKNPARYLEFMPLPQNCIAGATIETNWHCFPSILRAYYSAIGHAPSPGGRYWAMQEVKGRRFISVEPILDFDEHFAEWLIKLHPEFVYVGYDNYRHHLPEPSLAQTQALIAELQEAGIEVREKTLRKAWWEKE